MTKPLKQQHKENVAAGIRVHFKEHVPLCSRCRSVYLNTHLRRKFKSCAGCMTGEEKAEHDKLVADGHTGQIARHLGLDS